MPEKHYNIDWVKSPNNLPAQNSKCSKCGTEESVKTSQYGGMWCVHCKWKWKVSKWSQEQDGGTKAVIKELDDAEEIKKGIRENGLMLKQLLAIEDEKKRNDIPVVEEGNPPKYVG